MLQDDLDQKILRLLQRNGKLTYEEIGAMVDRSPSTIRDRIKKLEENKTIMGYSAIVNQERVGINSDAYISADLPPDIAARIAEERAKGRFLVGYAGGINPSNPVEAILDGAEATRVNTLHGQGLDRVAARLRIEAVAPIAADVVTARALAPLNDLLGWAYPFIQDRGAALFPKGQNVEEELTDTTKYWKMRTERFDSRTDPTGTILRVSGIARV